MLGPGRYLAGVAELTLLFGFAWLGASRLRARLLPGFRGAPACLATAVLALAILVLARRAAGLFRGLPAGVIPVRRRPHGPCPAVRSRVGSGPTPAGGTGTAATGPAADGPRVLTLVAFAVAAIAVAHFAAGVKTRLSTGMTGFDSTWYHGPFAAGFFQSGDTWNPHFIAPQFLAWFYPANGEIFHAAGMLAFGRDILSPLLNLGWFVGCLFACWCVGRPYRVGAVVADSWEPWH